MSCGSGQHPAQLAVDAGKQVTVGTLVGSVEDDDCVWSLKCDSTLLGEYMGQGNCTVPQYVSSAMQPTPEGSVSAALRAQQFGQKSPSHFGPWDALSDPPAGSCASSPGPAAPSLYCAQTKSPSWVAWRWYKFTEQPSIARAQLTSEQKAFVQSRVEKLHAMMGRSPSRWIKARGAAAEGLASVDSALLVTPPTGMEHGYVPVALYEGLQKPDGCVVKSRSAE